MTNLLVLNTSLSGENGKSNQLVSQYVEQLEGKTDVNVVNRDLAAENLPHLSGAEMQAWMTPAEERSDEQKMQAALSDTLVEEIEAADTLVIGMPMYNFGVPSVFKAWIDRVARAGRTFRYTENGPQGLLQGKKAVIFATRGGMYAGTEKDSQTQFLKDVLAFLGITDVEFVYAEGLAMGDEFYDKAWHAAEQKIIELIEKQAA